MATHEMKNPLNLDWNEVTTLVEFHANRVASFSKAGTTEYTKQCIRRLMYWLDVKDKLLAANREEEARNEGDPF